MSKPEQPFGASINEANPFAAPATMPAQPVSKTSGNGLWREHDNIIAANVALFPARCVKCNAPATKTYKLKNSWHHPALFLIILAGLLIYVIVALILRKTSVFQIYVCDKHVKQRRNLLLVLWLLIIPAIMGAGIFCLTNDDLVPFFFLSILVSIIAIAIVLSMVRYLRPTKINDTHSWLKGAGPEFLQQLPPV